MKNNVSKLKILIILVLILSFTLLVLRFWPGNKIQTRLDVFSQCLRDKGITMYGAEWCSHCQAQKQLFGKSFRYISYVECPQDPQHCLAVGIEAYPTWITANGEKMVGEQKLEDLSRISGCSLPIKVK